MVGRSSRPPGPTDTESGRSHREGIEKWMSRNDGGWMPAALLLDDAMTFFARVILLLDPLEGASQPVVQGRVRLPLERFFDESIVAIATGDAAGSIQVVMPLEFHSGDLLHFGNEVVNRNQL